MDSLGLVFLGVIAFASLVQGAFLVGLAIGGLRLARRIGEIQKSVETDIRPAIDDVSRLARNLASVSEIATGQAHRLETLVAHTMTRVEDARAQVRQAVARPFDSLSDVGAILKGVRRGLDVYRRLGGMAARRQGASRQYVGDEHLFI
jgi:hypothetical protein